MTYSQVYSVQHGAIRHS